MGEDGKGKSRVIKAIVPGLDLIDRKHEVILMAQHGLQQIILVETPIIPPQAYRLIAPKQLRQQQLALNDCGRGRQS
jgi:hypothetical protein